MDLKQIEKLMAAMGRHQMRKVSVEEEGVKLELEKEGMGTVTFAAPPMAAPVMPSAPQTAAPSSEGQWIESPMVGTFYAAASPEDPPFAKAGDVVDEGTVVCIIEAMKVMNEVKAGMTGTIAEVLVKNGDPVEFGTKMFKIT